jgi:hypothetical protein
MVRLPGLVIKTPATLRFLDHRLAAAITVHAPVFAGRRVVVSSSVFVNHVDAGQVVRLKLDSKSGVWGSGRALLRARFELTCRRVMVGDQR